MNQKHNLFLKTILLIILLYVVTSIPSQATSLTTSSITNITDTLICQPYNNNFTMFISPMYKIERIVGDYQANGSIDCFLTLNATSLDYYASTGIIPPDALWSTTGTSGSFDVITPDGFALHHYYFGNRDGSDWVEVTYNLTLYLEIKIPGFEFIYGLFAILAILGILYHKKRLNF